MTSFQQLDSQTVYQGRVFDVRVDNIRLPDGREISLDIVAHAGAVTLVPVDEQGFIWFIRQYRHAARGEILELPAGVIEDDEPPDQCARRELREETGMAATYLEKLGEFFLAPGYSTEYMYVYLARGLSPAPLPQDEDEIISTEKISIKRAYQLAKQGAIQDAKSLAALLLLRSHLDLKSDDMDANQAE
jgi:ADP-ribose pyrophosphatase